MRSSAIQASGVCLLPAIRSSKEHFCRICGIIVKVPGRRVCSLKWGKGSSR